TNKHVDHLSIIAKTLFKSNALFVGPSHEWKFENNSYTFEFDSMPKINFTSGNLVCASRLNDIKIEDTKGYYSIQDKLFFGQGGRVPWNISGYDPKKTYATLNTYEIALPDQSYSAENVYFHSEYSNTPLKGTLEDKLVQTSEGNKRNYPVFQSTEGRIQIKNIIPNVDYEGGFILAGESFKGTGPQNNPAQLIINKDGKKFLESKSQLFNIRPQIIESLSAQIKFAVDSDSIFHPSLYLALNRKTRELTLSRTEDGVSPSPFINTYHNMEMYFESIQWNIDAPLMNFGAYGPTAQKFADFESVEYFDKERYRTIQGISTIHPCTILSETYNRLGQTTFTIVDFATTARTGIEQWIPLLFDLNVKGYIIFEPETRMITIKPKLLNHIETNRLLKDYDILQFSSSVNQGSNAQLSLLSQELKIEGVNNIVVSDSQLVRIYPKNGTV
ncbi:MAG: hypothetical protein ACKO8Q_05485, partial [Bacteroidota bacterium]